ncbi:hypothetical protein HQN89_33970 [Paenibacillus frigoriresistens]|uniref:hypothetical protein n=1 Tax=Paenibacillus alginolyticus TaxID=59839 RepID=UPI0015662288|nr:hypothetical protein [Paenibacillus frigoriresistens]NRF95821.1 hypothetical protein [Paenibacillus frigoriresistens]
MEMKKEKDIGVVTPNGIWFEGMIYSCSLAIKHQWFKISERIGGWPISVEYDKAEPNEIYIKNDEGELIRCFRIDHIQVEATTLGAYQLELRRLIALKHELRSKHSLIIEKDPLDENT